MPLTAHEGRYWQAYLETLRPSGIVQPPHVTAGCAGRPQDTDDLLARYLDGTKTAGSSLVEDFLAANDPVPKVGDCWIVLSSGGEPRCILRTVKIEMHRFQDVPVEIAVAEGEGDLSLAHWRRVHAASYTPHLEAWGVDDLDEATVVTEFFDVVFS